MRLCFGTFCSVLLVNKKNSAISQEIICRSLLNMLDPNYCIGKTSSYLGMFANSKRNLPRELICTHTEAKDIQGKFELLISECLIHNTENLRSSLTHLISADRHIDGDTKNRLLTQSMQAELSAFLAELYLFIVKNTVNVAGKNEVKQMSGHATQSLLEQIYATQENDILYSLAMQALDTNDVFALTVCMDRMTNDIYICRALVAISGKEGYADNNEYADVFHRTMSRVKGNNYRYEAMEAMLKDGYFAAHPEQLLDAHISEYTNQKYLYMLLCLLCDMGMGDMARGYAEFLTHKKYSRELEARLGG